MSRAWDPVRWRSTFLAIWTGQAFSLFGSHLVQFSLVWWLTQTTGSATVLAGATIVALLPQILVAPMAGALVDRWNRRWVMVFADGGIALATLGLAALFAAGVARVWHVYLALLVRAVGGAFHWPAMQAATAIMVPERHLARVGGLNQSLFGLASIVSPPAGALLLGVLPMHGVLAIDVATALFAIPPLLVFRIPRPSRDPSASARTSVFADFRAGLRFVLGWRALLAIIVAAAGINLFASPAVSLMPLLVTRHFGGGAIQLAGLESAFGIGVVVGGVLLGVWGGFRRRIVTVMSALLVEGMGFVAMGILPAAQFGMAVGACGLVGVMNSISNGALFAVIQAAVPHDMQGRVMSILISGATAASPIGLAIAGPLADRYGVPLWYVLAGALMAVVSLLFFAVPGLLRFAERDPQGEARAPDDDSPQATA
ncbi:MAG: MFS transporter [Candidatus Bipolaricaulis sp.]|nr:MFS transporter [Candidatus Bipolaricaulis sp.]